MQATYNKLLLQLNNILVNFETIAGQKCNRQQKFNCTKKKKQKR